MKKSLPVRIPVEVRPAFMPRFNGSRICDQQAKILHTALNLLTDDKTRAQQSEASSTMVRGTTLWIEVTVDENGKVELADTKDLERELK